MVLAQDVCREIPADSIFCEAIHRNFNLFLYGAVAPDSCFHYILGPRRSVINHAGSVFHTTNSSSLVPILEFLKRFPQKEMDALAFAAGLCCHIMTDTVFHPMVFYFSGAKGVHPDSDARHRMLETLLDLHFRAIRDIQSNYIKEKQVQFFHTVKQLEISENRLLYLLKNIFCLDRPECQKHLLYAFKSHCLANFLFSKHALYQLMNILSNFNILTEYGVLFYPYKSPARFGFFDGNLKFKHPVSGEKYNENLGSLTQKTIKNSLQLLSIIEASISAGGNLDEVILNTALPKIAPSLPENTQEFRYWNGDRELKEKLYSDVTV